MIEIKEKNKMKNIISYLFGEPIAFLHDGTQVKDGDMVEWIDSDKNIRQDLVQKRSYDYRHSETGVVLKKGSLFVVNPTYNPCDYSTAKKL